MQLRQPRLGDILDDYCPRERRVTNHAVVAMVGEDVKQTRCTTCDAEHEYKKARVPAQRKKKEGANALYDEVLTGMPRKLATAAPAAAPVAGDLEDDVAGVSVPAADGPSPAVAAAPAGTLPVAGPPHDDSDGPVHRPLIRATLPRPEGQVKERQIPEFTARTAATRSGRFRPHGGGHGGPHGQGQGRGQGGGQHAGARFGRRGQGPSSFASAGTPGQGNRAPSSHGDRQGPRRRGGGKGSK